jgi:hypothetical protein
LSSRHSRNPIGNYPALVSARPLQLRKLGRHRRVAAGELFDRQVVGLVVGQAQVVGGLVQRFLGFLQVFDGLVNAPDYIFREADDNGVEIVSIMFEMKNKSDETATKKRNEDFLKELDKDRTEKACEYAVLVSLLEPESELYNSGIVDVSHRYPKMYVVRPQFFVPLITLLRNAALNSLKYKSELALVAQVGRVKLLASDAREDHAVAPWESEFALVPTFSLHQLRVALQRIDDLDGAVAGLLQRIHHRLDMPVRDDFKVFPRGLANGVQSPIFRLQNQRPSLRMDHHKVRVGLLRPHGHVVPQQVVVLQLLLQPLGQTALARSHARHAGAECRDQCRHERALCPVDISLHIMPADHPQRADLAHFGQQKGLRRPFHQRKQL